MYKYLLEIAFRFLVSDCILAAYVPVALLTSVAVRHPRVAAHVQNRCRMKIQNAQKSATSPTLNPFKKKLAQRAEKKYQKLLTLAEDDAKKFYFGIMLGLFLNETILMPPQENVISNKAVIKNPL